MKISWKERDRAAKDSKELSKASREKRTRKLERTLKSTKRSEPQRIRERRGSKSCLNWDFSYVKAQKNSNLFSQSSFDTRFSLQFKLRSNW